MTLFGWCTTGHHAICIIEVVAPNKTYICACECHVGDKLEE